MNSKIILNAEDQIACPHCNSEFPIKEAVAKHLIEKHEDEYQQLLSKELVSLQEQAAKSPGADGKTRVHAACCDIREPDQVEAFVAGVLEQFGQVDVLVNNAGGQFPCPAENMSPKGWNAVVRNNLNGTFFMTREVATKAMIPRKRGRIVMITAMVARGFPGMSHTGAARAGVENLTESLAIEWAPAVRVCAVTPGLIATPESAAHYPDPAAIAATVPMGRFGSPEDVADAVAFLASNRATYATGTHLVLDGGGEWPAFLRALGPGVPGAPPSSESS